MVCAWECCLETQRRNSLKQELHFLQRNTVVQAGLPVCAWLHSPAEGVGESIRPDDCEEESWAGHIIRASWRLITESETYFIALKCPMFKYYFSH